MKSLIPIERVERHIYLIRGQKVMLDRDLADLYKVPTKALNQAVARHGRRFPDDFMFKLSRVETKNWRSQIVTSNLSAKMSLRRCPYAFTEQGVAMLSSVLQSDRAIDVNIQIIRAFTKIRLILTSHKALARKLEWLESNYDAKFKVVFDAIRHLMAPPVKHRRRRGFGH